MARGLDNEQVEARTGRPALDQIDVPWTRPCSKQIAVYRKAATARLDEFIGAKA